MTITITPQIDISTPYIADLMRYFGLLHAKVALTDFKLIYDNTNNDYLFRINAVDGRKWIHRIVKPVDNSVNYGLSTNADTWYREEFVAMRPMRDAVAGLIMEYNITELKIVF